MTDPGAGHLRVEYPLDQFMDAWKDSKCFMAATNDPAPYQYDPETGMEVPSNFMVERFVNDFIINNGYQLAPDLINVPEEYHPSFTGHIEMVGDLSYDEWEDKYDNMVNSRMPSLLSMKEQIEASAQENALSHEIPGKEDGHKDNSSIEEESSSVENEGIFNTSPVTKVYDEDVNNTDEDEDDDSEDDENEDSEDDIKDSYDDAEGIDEDDEF